MQQEVQSTYNKIATDFSRTRYRVWSCTSEFLDNIHEKSYGLEVGCGNGKNMIYRKDLNLKGIDICDNFVKICKDQNLDVVQGDMTNLPYDNNSFDFVFCIAALHHLNTIELRIHAINEMFRVCKQGGKVFVYVWALEQPADSKRKFTKSDEMVSWKSTEDDNIYYRYYHIYKKGELLNEFNLSDYKFNINRDFYEKGNWGIIVEKL
jgi:ubiquinone/menaquinone biosynthesis C-methylase UbiE